MDDKTYREISPSSQIFTGLSDGKSYAEDLPVFSQPIDAIFYSQNKYQGDISPIYLENNAGLITLQIYLKTGCRIQTQHIFSPDFHRRGMETGVFSTVKTVVSPCQ